MTWYPGKHIWEGTKKFAKEHPSLTGALAVGGTVVAVIGTGPVGILAGLSAAAAGSSIAKNIAAEAKKQEEEGKKE